MTVNWRAEREKTEEMKRKSKFQIQKEEEKKIQQRIVRFNSDRFFLLMFINHANMADWLFSAFLTQLY